ncbi:MAG: RNA-directed DNA polymerase [Betaproteobacteria bacterium]|nr:RNA-directed DNA polymerase [Betaproteobacteria bacterium]
MTEAYARLCSWENLLAAWHKAARGKRGRRAAAAFEARLADNLLELQVELLEGRYRPGGYVHFVIHEPKRRRISAAPFRDRVVHHALCNVIEPRFERLFIADSYANRVGRGTHRAIDRFQSFARRYRYVLRGDVVQHFPSIDHEVLRAALARVIPEPDVMALVDAILGSGDGALAGEYRMVWFPGDDLLAACRARGLPIGNLTSQFWSNCHLHAFDEFVKRELRCRAYLRYVDDFALFDDSPQRLWAWKHAIVRRLARLRLTIHESRTQVAPTARGASWLGFVVYPEHRRVKARKVVEATQRLWAKVDAYRSGTLTRDGLRASLRGWVNHVRQADSLGLRRHVFSTLGAQAHPGAP